jgi:hypothetical protein
MFLMLEDVESIEVEVEVEAEASSIIDSMFESELCTAIETYDVQNEAIDRYKRVEP